MKNIILALLILPFISSCWKNELKIVNKADKRMGGIYEVESITTILYDSTGAVDSTRTFNHPGNIELRYVNSDEEVFNELIFPAALNTQSWIFKYFFDNQSVYYHWDADPAEARIVLWTISNTGYSYHITLNQERNGDDFTWTYIRSNNATGPTSTTMRLKEVFKLKKTNK